MIYLVAGLISGPFRKVGADELGNWDADANFFQYIVGNLWEILLNLLFDPEINAIPHLLLGVEHKSDLEACDVFLVLEILSRPTADLTGVPIVIARRRRGTRGYPEMGVQYIQQIDSRGTFGSVTMLASASWVNWT